MLSARSIRMYELLSERDEILIERGPHHYLNVGNTEYQILDETVTDYSNHPIISVGALEREQITLNPKSRFLHEKYLALKAWIEDPQSKLVSKEPSETKDNAETIAPEQVILNKTLQFVRAMFDEAKSTEEEIKKIVAAHKGEKNGVSPVIPVDEFVKLGIGVCRHRTVVLAYLLNQLILDHILPPGNILYHRDEIPMDIGFGHYSRHENVAHTWLFYRPETMHFDAYLVDAQNCETTYLLCKDEFNLPYEYKEGFTPYENCLDRCGLIKFPSFYTSYSDKEKTEFLLDRATSLQRRKILNYEQAQGGDITRFLPEETSHSQYEEFKADITRIKNTETLHKLSYKSSKTEEDKQQFLFGLLMQGKKSRNSIIAAQPLADLIALRNHLETTNQEQRRFYQTFVNYNALFDDITQDLANRIKRNLPTKSNHFHFKFNGRNDLQLASNHHGDFDREAQNRLGIVKKPG